MCVRVACYLSGGSGERKLLQGKFWGKWLLNPNIQVGMYINTNRPIHTVYLQVWMGMCVCLRMFIFTHVITESKCVFFKCNYVHI